MPTGKNTPTTFNSDIYTKVTLHDLVAYAIYFLHRQGSEITSQDIIAASFILFPKRFSLQKYPQWPDAGIVSRGWGNCKRRGYLLGNAIKGFKLTARGIKRAEKIEKLLGRVEKSTLLTPMTKARKPALPAVTSPPELKARARKYVRSIQASDAYKHYQKRLPLNEFDFRSLLLCTMESPSATLARNLEQFKVYVNVHDRTDLLTFLEFCENKFSHLLGKATRPVEKKVAKSKK